MPADSASANSTASLLLLAPYLALTAVRLSMSVCWQRVRWIARLLRCSGGSAGRYAGRLVISDIHRDEDAAIVVRGAFSMAPSEQCAGRAISADHVAMVGDQGAFEAKYLSALDQVISANEVSRNAVLLMGAHGDLLVLLASRCAFHVVNVLQEVRECKRAIA